jgi:adenylate kinase
VTQRNLVLLGPPGAGKGTQADRLREDFDLPYYATGNILRDAIASESELGKQAKEIVDAGDLVPDDLIFKVIEERLASTEAQDGFLLDGFPRTIGQAEMLEQSLDKRGRQVTAALLIDAPDEEVVRDDDKPETVKKRLEVYHEQTEPLIQWYSDRGLLRRFDGTRTPEEVHSHIRATLATLAFEDET